MERRVSWNCRLKLWKQEEGEGEEEEEEEEEREGLRYEKGCCNTCTERKVLNIEL